MNASVEPDAPGNGAAHRIPWTKIAIGTTVAFCAAFAVRIVHLPDVPITDELYHLLAAASWVESGSLAIADGIYTRASMFTRMIGVVHWLFDGNVTAVRAFCVVIGSLLVAGAFAWTARFVGQAEAIVTASFLIIMPGAIFLSQHIRFYSLHALIFFAVAAGIYYLVTVSLNTTRRLVVLTVLVALTLLALHLQVTTLIGVAGIFLWILIVSAPNLQFGQVRKHHVAVATISVAVTFVVALLLGRDFLTAGIDVYQASALWNSNEGPDYYFRFYKDQFGAFWSLFPAAAICAMAVRPKPASFCLCIFGVAFVGQSFGGMRAERFLFYAMPFFFVTWAIAAVATVRGLWQLIEQSLVSSMRSAELHGRVAAIAGVLVAMSAAFLVVATPATEVAVKMILGRPVGTASEPAYWDRYAPSWEISAPDLRDLADVADVVVVSQPLHALYYLGDYDYALNATMLADLEAAGVLGNMDPRTGRPVFADAKSLMELVACHESGLVIVHAPAWRNRTRVNAAAADAIESFMNRIDLARQSDLLVYAWDATAERPTCENPRQ